MSRRSRCSKLARPGNVAPGHRSKSETPLAGGPGAVPFDADTNTFVEKLTDSKPAVQGSHVRCCFKLSSPDPTEAAGGPVRILGTAPLRWRPKVTEPDEAIESRSPRARGLRAPGRQPGGAGPAPHVWERIGGSSKVRVPDDLGSEPLEVAKTALGGGDIDRACPSIRTSSTGFPTRWRRCGSRPGPERRRTMCSPATRSRASATTSPT